MFKYLSTSGLIALALFAPLFVSAKENSQARRTERVMAQMKQIKHKTDVQVSLSGKVTALSGSTVTLLAANGSSYTVDASAAKLIRRYGAVMTVADIQMNDQLYVQGTLLGSTIKAKLIQDLSLQARNGSFTGTVQSISSDRFMLQSNNRGVQTIFFASSTKFMKGNTPATSADLRTGMSVRVDGVWNNTNSNVTANKVQIVVKHEEVHLNGTIASIAGTTMMFNGPEGRTYGVDLGSAKIAGRNYYGTEVSKLKAGDAVQVWGKTMTESLQIKANLVIDFSM